MPRYLLVRTVGGTSEEDIKTATAREEEVRKRMPDVRWIRSCYSVEEGKVYCEYEAPSLEAIYELNRRRDCLSTMPRWYGTSNPRWFSVESYASGA